MPMLRPRSPTENAPFVIRGVQPGKPGTQSVPLGRTDGRSVWFDWSLLVSWLLRILNGRPDAISKIGASVKSARNLYSPSPERHLCGEAKTALKTNLCR